ncbi:uncharacterized protein LOC113517020 [Galleria mellonella]|uniref:Uncharacterized protein LOC113517020 n=1 Tax=Galleria mellonella TaxID=7137 RepID=A0A6J1WWQ7_GALME|nr:uncharacterized protein LOC113517020 [Galleria mellonella]
MSGEAETEAPRPRPLSGGLWTFLSWLRRDEHSSSSESLSSAGSDRTAASFAFLAPAHYCITTSPIILPPSGPPTDSYKKRVREINKRRQNDRDLTLHRKYGLHRGEGNSSYDAFSLPPPRRFVLNNSETQDRDRRATSELLQRRAAYVPGKRRAPAPPVRASSVTVSSLTRRPTRKRPAPQPPTKLIERSKQNCNNNIQMNSQTVHNENTLSCDNSMDCKSEKYIKKGTNSKENKIKQEKGFLKQIFDNKKRNSAIDVSAIKILPNISELDKQAAEIIESSKRNILKGNKNLAITRLIKDYHNSAPNIWLCKTCSRQHDKSVTICPHCFSKQNSEFSINKNKNDTIYTQTENQIEPINTASNSRLSGSDEKQKLREMLKEMKDSLPKRPKHDTNNELNNTNICTKSNLRKTVDESSLSKGNVLFIEAPTLRIGSSLLEQNNASYKPLNQSLSRPINQNEKNNVEQSGAKSLTPGQIEVTVAKASASSHSVAIDNDKDSKVKGHLHNVNGYRPDSLNTPLRISSLLNPVYIPKCSDNSKEQLQKNILDENCLLNSHLKNTPKIKENAKTENSEISTNLLSSTTSSTSISSNEKSISKDTTSKINRISMNLPSSNAPSTSSSSNQKLASNYEKSVKSKEKNFVKIDIAKENNTQNKLQTKIKSIQAEEKELSEMQLNETSFSKDNPVLLNNETSSTSNIDKINQHIRRRDLVNQLEQSIAKGDEHAAAQAAIKLAQLRLSCSVLSFTSQILGEASTSLATNVVSDTKIDNKPCELKVKASTTQPLSKSINSGTQTSVSAGSKGNIINVQKSINKNNYELISPEKDKVSSPLDNKFHIQSQKNNNEASTSKKVGTEPSEKGGDNIVSISILIEDKETARGPVQLRINREARLGHLRRHVEVSLGIASRLQRWIIGRTLCTEDDTLLNSLAGPNLNAPFYLYLVEYGIETNTGADPRRVAPQNSESDDSKNKTGNVYTELVQLERQALVPNTESFQCQICMEECLAGRGAVLRECVHTFCRDCLADLIRHCEEPAVSCPAMGCPGTLHEREIRALVPLDEYERWLARGLAAAESRTRNAFHCRTRDCTGWAFCEPGVRKFPCPVCKSNNCVPCQAIHEGETCEQYRNKLQQAVNGNESRQTDEGTRALLDTLISRGEALECPECSAIITKKWGCDWVKCSACKTEICWVTRGRRWGPGGKGDTSGGCRCGIDGKRCHPSCGYCH